MSHETRILGTELAPQPLTPDEQRLKEALTLPPELHATLSAEFDVIAERAVLAEIDPQDSRNLDATLAIRRWKYFGDSDLPAQTRLERWEDTLSLVPDPNLGLQEVWPGEADAALGAVYHAMRPTLSGQIDVFSKEQLRRQPAYQLLSSLISQQPQNEDQPPNAYWRQIYTQQAEQSIRANFGIAEGASLQQNLNAQQALYRELRKIDELTMPRKNRSEQTPRQRFLGWALESIKTSLDDDFLNNAGIDRENIVDIISRNEAVYLVGVAEGVLIEKELDGGTLQRWSFLVSLGGKDAGVDLSIANVRDDRLAQYVLEDCLRYPTANLRGILEDNADELRANRHDYPSIETLLRLRGVSAEIYPSTANGRVGQISDRNGVATEIISRGQYELGAAQIIGSATLSGAGVARPQLLMLGSFVPNLPSFTADWHLRINAPVGNPLVPGFELVAARAGEDYQNTIYEFQQIDEDLYEGAESIQIPQEGKQALTEYYQKIGAIKLIEAFGKYGEMTIDNLQKVIKATSDYTFDASLSPSSDEDFSAYVEEGRLQLQCTGAANFLAHSLRIAMPDTKTQVIAGRSIKRDGVIRALGHAQVLIVHEGKKYILDATPALAGITAGRAEEFLGDDFPIESQDFSPTQTSQPTPEEALDVPLTDTQAYFAREHEHDVQLSSLRSQLETVLKNTFRVRNQKELHKTMSKLSKADPMHRALSAVIRYDKSSGEVDEREQAAKYLQNCFKPSNEKFRKRFGITKYDPAVIDLVLGILR